jgi:hypothetical protein
MSVYYNAANNGSVPNALPLQSRAERASSGRLAHRTLWQMHGRYIVTPAWEAD